MLGSITVAYRALNFVIAATKSILTIAVTCFVTLFVGLTSYIYHRKILQKRNYELSWIVQFDEVQFPRDVQDWLRRRYTLIDDGTGGLAVGDAIRTARRALAQRKGQAAGEVEFLGTVEYNNKARFSIKKGGVRNNGVYKKNPVTITTCPKDVVYVTSQVIQEVKTVRNLRTNDNVAKFVGASVEWQKVAVFYEFCAKGNLQVRLLEEMLG